MQGITVRTVGSLAVAAILSALAVGAVIRHERAPAGFVAVPAVELPNAPSTSVVAVAAPPVVDLATELRAIGTRALQAQRTSERAGIAADSRCVRPSAKETKLLRKKVGAWIDRTYANELPTGDLGDEAVIGCKDAGGVIVEVHADREGRYNNKALGRRDRLRRHWILRVTDDGITQIADKTSESTIDAMEWSDEGFVSALALIDLDADGIRDVVWASVEHEGGAVRSGFTVFVWRSATATNASVLTLDDAYLYTAIIDDSVVFTLATSDNPFAFGCLTPTLAIVHCASGEIAKREQRRFEIAARYSTIKADALPDRELLAEELAILRLPNDERPPLLSAAFEPTTTDRIQRNVRQLFHRDDLADVLPGPHPEATTYFASLRAQLGDTPCETAPLTTLEQERAAAWLAANIKPKASKPLELLDIKRACGSYIWVRAQDQGAAILHDVLLVIDGMTVTKLLAFKTDDCCPACACDGAEPESLWFRHGDTIVGAVIDTSKVFAIANGRVVAKRKGGFNRYRFDDHWPDASDDVITGENALWHPTATGFERVDRAFTAAHRADRMARYTLENVAPENSPTYIHALTRLGAPRSLVRAVESL